MTTIAPIVELVLAMAPVEPDILPAAAEPSAWVRLAGRLHPATVHFPIALIMTAAVLEILGWLRPQARREGQRVGAALVCLAIGAPAACLAAWLGWINADLESQSASVERTLFLHRWTGISIAVLACLALLLGLLARVRKTGWVGRLYWLALLLSMPAVGLGGYLGGELVHGEGHLLEVFRDASSDDETAIAGGGGEVGGDSGDSGDSGASGAARPVPDPEFVATVLPILESRCFECHGSDKKKGNLRLNTHESVFGGDPEYWVIKPGDAQASLVVERIELPDEDLDRMPANGDPLTPEEIKAIRDWIDRGASYVGVEARAAAPRSAAAAPDATPAAPVEGTPVADVAERRADAPGAIDAKMRDALEALGTRGAVAMPRAADGPDVDVNFSLASPPTGDTDLGLLAGLEANLVWLNLARSDVTDAGLERLSGFKRLRHLHLERTAVGDTGAAHLARLSSLEYLNLYGTNMTDEGLADLAGLRNLRHLYLWQTGVTDAGVAALRARLPELTIDTGQALLPPPAPQPPDSPDSPDSPDPPDAEESAEGAGEDEADADLVANLPACCVEARADGGECTHPCCVAAAAKGIICERCAG